MVSGAQCVMMTGTLLMPGWCADNWDTMKAVSFALRISPKLIPHLNDSHLTAALSNAFFGEGRGAIILDDVRCSGIEPTITSCDHNEFFEHDCGHDEDASVICSQTCMFSLHHKFPHSLYHNYYLSTTFPLQPVTQVRFCAPKRPTVSLSPTSVME